MARCRNVSLSSSSDHVSAARSTVCRSASRAACCAALSRLRVYITITNLNVVLLLYVMYERTAPEPFDVIRKRTRRDTGLTTRVLQTDWLAARYKEARLEASEGAFWNMNRIVCLHVRTCVDCCFPC